MVSPFRLLILFLYVAVMAGIIILMSPGQIEIASFSIQIPTWKDIARTKNVKAVDSNIQELDTKIDSLDMATTTEVEEVDTAKTKQVKVGDIKVTTKPNDIAVEYPDNDPSALYNFFDALSRLSETGELIRILHYGDSQLDGDRISEYVRNRFQGLFGGCGVGLVPVLETQNIRSTLNQKASENWNKYAIYGINNKKSKHNYYGLLGSYFRFSHPLPVGAESREVAEKAWVSFSKSKYAYKKNNQVEKTQLLYKNPHDSLVVKYHYQGKEGRMSFPKAEETSVAELPISGALDKVSLNFESKGTPEVYGFTFDCQSGVAFDNIAFRGSSGTEFTRINRTFFKKQVRDLNVKLIIIQFGVNVIPNVLTDYKYYENALLRQLKYLKAAAPDMNILVVGVSDMARKRGPNIESYPNIRLVRAAQRQAAFKSGCAYWDLFTAMGGENSIVSWVDSDPPLANKDYTHFSRRGAKLVGEMLFNELMREYKKYKGNPEVTAKK